LVAPNVAVSAADAEVAVAAVLALPELDELVTALTASTGRRGYGPRCLLGAVVVQKLYLLPTATRTARLLREHDGLADVIGGRPSEWAIYRFWDKLKRQKADLEAGLDRIVRALHREYPEMGREVAVDATDMPAYSNGQKFGEAGPRTGPVSDVDAGWGIRMAISTRGKEKFFGHKLHLAACVRTGLPLAWLTVSGNRQETLFVLRLLDSVRARGFAPEVCVLDKAFDHNANYDGCHDRGCRPVIAMREEKKTTKKRPSGPPRCEHGLWKFGGADMRRRAAKWRCPTGECRPASKWVKADRFNTVIPRETKRWRRLYWKRVAIEREFGNLKHQFGLLPLRVRGRDRVALHADLTILARLSLALARARAVPLAA
jgi:hypothetical protein